MALTSGKFHRKNGFMTGKLTVDQAGRVVLPKPLLSGSAPLRKERGIWVYRTGKPLTAATTDQTLREIREQRDRAHTKPR